MAERRFGDVTVEVVQGDITRQPDVDAIANAANAELRTGGGVAGAIHRAAGPGLEAEAVPLGPIAPGECVLTSGHDLPNPHVLHCLGPVHGRDEPSDELLASCYRRGLEIVDEHGLRSVAFPAISTGVFGYPVAPAAEVALTTIRDAAPSLRSVRLVRMVLHAAGDLAIHEDVLRDLPD